MKFNNSVNFYYNDDITTVCLIFTTVATVLTVLISPLFIYTVLTQSKQLGHFKWFLLNHSVWCIAFEFTLTLYKPVALFPAPAYYITGFLSNYESSIPSAVVIFTVFMCVVMSIGGLSMTLIYRYSGIFPGVIKEFFRSKRSVVTYIVLHVLFMGAVAFYVVKFALLQREQMLDNASNYDVALQQFFTQPTFTFYEIDMIRPVCFAATVLLVLIIALFVALSSTLFYELKRANKAATTFKEKLQKTLVLSVISQIMLTVLIQFVPFIVLFTSLSWTIPHTGPVMMCLVSVLSTHAVLEMASTLYFVLPYRRFITKIGSKVFKSRNQPPHNFVISSNTFNSHNM